MKKVCFFLVIACCTHAFGQQMQEFNQLYSEKEYQKKLVKARNAVIDAADTQKANTAFAPATPDDQKALQEALKKEDAEDPKFKNLSALPAFTNLLGKDVLLPKMEITGSTNFKGKNGFYGDAKIFTAGVTAQEVNYSKVFFTETSNYGVAVSFNYIPKLKKETKGGDEAEEAPKWLCAYVGANYLGKNLYGIDKDNGTADTTKFTSAFGHLKYGVQVNVFENLLSFYVDANHIVGLTNRDPLIQYAPSLSNGFTNFLNVGSKIFLATDVEKKPLNMFVDFSGVVMSSALKKVYNTSDKIVLRVSVGGAVRF